MIEVKKISKRYGNKQAIKDVSFTVNKGEILGFLGPNGAGKSTTMKIITGFIPPSEGTVVVDGFDILDDDMEVKKRIGYLPENPPLYGDMLVSSFLYFVGEIKGIPKNNIRAKVSEVMEALNITDVSNRLIKNLSKGYKQRVGLAQAILGNPDVLILDEPTIGLDPSQITEIRALIKRLGEDKTIILSTHILPEVSQLCDRVIIINKGEIVAIDTPENLANKAKHSNIVEARIVGTCTQVIEKINSIEGVIKVDILGEKEKGAIDYSIESEEQIDIRPILFRTMAEDGYIILELKTVKASLEDVFLQLTTQENIQEESKEVEVLQQKEEENEQDASNI